MWLLIRGLPVVEAFVTGVDFLLHPLRFTDEVVREDWQGKAKPVHYLLAMYFLALLVSVVQFSPWKSRGYLTALQQGYQVASEVLTYAVAYFVLNLAVHACLGCSQLPFVRSFYLFCYLQGSALLIVTAIGVFFLIFPLDPSWLESNISANNFFWVVHSTLVIPFVYTLVASIRAYRPRWYRLLFGIPVGLVVVVTVIIGSVILRNVVMDISGVFDS